MKTTPEQRQRLRACFVTQDNLFDETVIAVLDDLDACESELTVLRRGDRDAGWVTWNRLLDLVAPDENDEYGWRWVRDDAGFWYADALLDGFTICCPDDIETWDDGQEQAGAYVERSNWPKIAALVDARAAFEKARR